MIDGILFGLHRKLIRCIHCSAEMDTAFVGGGERDDFGRRFSRLWWWLGDTTGMMIGPLSIYTLT